MMRGNTNLSFMTNGSSALKPVRHVQLRVIEGGLPQGDSKGDSSPFRSRGVDWRPFGRLAYAMLGALLLAAVMGSVLSSHSRKAALSSAAIESVHVVSGDTLWGIAAQHEVRGASTQDVVKWIMEHNDVDAGNLVAGQTLRVPRS